MFNITYGMERNLVEYNYILSKSFSGEVKTKTYKAEITNNFFRRKNELSARQETTLIQHWEAEEAPRKGAPPKEGESGSPQVSSHGIG